MNNTWEDELTDRWRFGSLRELVELKTFIRSLLKQQRENSAEIFKSYCELNKHMNFKFADDFNLYCKMLAESTMEEK